MSMKCKHQVCIHAEKKHHKQIHKDKAERKAERQLCDRMRTNFKQLFGDIKT